MEGCRPCDNTIPESEFYQKSSSDLVHPSLTQLNQTINIPEGLIEGNIHNVIHVLQVEHYCRLCGTETDGINLVDIFGEQGSQMDLQKKIVDHLRLQVQKGDQLPQHVCNTCVYQLNICHQLFDCSHAADAKLRQLFLIPQVTGSSDICLNVGVDMMPHLKALEHHESNSVTVVVGQVEEVSVSESNMFINGLSQGTADSSVEKCANTEVNKQSENMDVTEAEKKNESTQSLLCHVCGKSFKQPSNLQAHKRTHLADSLKKKHHCSLCPNAFRSKFHLSEHMNIHNGVTPYNCPECGKSFHKRAQLRQHSLVHVHDSKKVVCEVCGLRFSRRSNLLAHAKTHAENRTFDCRLCHMQFPTFSGMLSHRKKHSQEDIKKRLSLNLVKNKEQIYTCDVCGKIFTNKDSLVSHIEQHKTGGMLYACTDCGKLLRSRRSLAYHQRSQHSGDRPYRCSYCSEGFMTKKLQQAHERRHTGEKPFKCNVCWKGFRSKNNLNQHMLKHSGEKNFECLVCRKKFYRKGALTVHNRQHTGEKPFICDLCGRPFGQKNDMLKHQKTHLEGHTRTRTCDLCAMVFTSKKEMAKHKATAHKESVSLVPLIITNNMFETHIITEDGQKIVFTTVEALDENNLVTPSTNEGGVVQVFQNNVLLFVT